LNELANINDRRMSTNEICKALKCDKSTLMRNWHEIEAAATVAGAATVKKVEHGKPTYWTETEMTLLLEKMKGNAHNQHDLAVQLQGTETSQSRVLKLQLLQRQMQDIYEAEIADLNTSVARLEAKVEADRHKTVMFDQCMESGSLMSISTMAKKLARRGLDPRKIFAFLRDRKIILRNHASYWVPYQPYIDRGFFVVKQEQGARTVIDDITRVTQRGYAFVMEMVNEAYPMEATA